MDRGRKFLPSIHKGKMFMPPQDNNNPPERIPFWKAASFWISALSLIVSGIALFFAILAREDTRDIHKLDLKPQINLRTYFGKTDKLVPQLTVENEGPVDAVQIDVQILSHRYDESSKSIKVSTYGTPQNWKIPKLSPFQFKTFLFSEHFLNINARLQKPVQHNIMEIRLSYRRPSDMRLFKESAYYFVNPEGRWVPEGDNSLEEESYEAIKRAVFKKSKRPLEYIGLSDTLHKIDVSNEQ
jgi:hypothetical protein